MTQFVAWVLFPLILGLLCMGCGLLLQAASGVRLPAGLHLPLGLAVIIAVAELPTKISALASATTPLLVAVAAYLVYLAPVLFSGEPTFTGFIKLDDTATWMGMTDRVLSAGHTWASLPPSTYQAMLQAYLTGGEPVGSMLPWGITHQIVGQDLASEFQPYLAFLGAMIALTGWAIARPFVRVPALRALVALIAAQAALLYGYSLWGGIKEVAAALLLVVSVASIIPILESRARVRSFLPLIVSVLAMLGVNGYAGAVWLPVPLAAAGLIGLQTWLRQRAWAQLAALGAAAIAVIVVLGIRGGSIATQNASLTSATEYGNLAH